jgi:hypothetical protein
MAEQKDYLRIGKISSFNYPNGTARVTYEDKDQSTTVEMPFISYQYWMPAVGDQVLVAHLSTGTSAAVILGPVWHDGMRPDEGFEGLYKKEYANRPGKAGERYDAKDEAYNQSVTGTMDINSTEAWTVTVKEATVLQLDPDGNITMIAAKSATITIGSSVVQLNGDGTISVDAPTKIAVTTPTFRLDGNLEVTGDVTAGSAKISLVNHTHTGDSGGSTSKPK